MSVVIVTFDSGNVIRQALDSVVTFLPDTEIIVVDNGSRDDTLAVVSAFDHVRLVSGHGNVGFGAGVNIGVDVATQDHVLVINPDVTLTHTNRPALESLQGQSIFGLVACCSSTGTCVPVLAVRGWRRELLLNLFSWFLKPAHLKIKPKAAQSQFDAWVGGHAFLLRRDEWLRIGGFDNSIFLYYEDVDLGRRYGNASLPLYATNAILVEHHRQAARSTDLALLQSWAFRSLTQTTATWEGSAAAQHNALATVAGLWIVERALLLASALVTGRLRRRAVHHAAGALRVRKLLAESPPSIIPERHYRAANLAYADAFRIFERFSNLGKLRSAKRSTSTTR